MAAIDRFEDIEAWREARSLTHGIYEATRQPSFAKDPGLRDQMQRASVSIMANIAEGFKKRGRPDKVRFLNIAQGSLEECRYYLILARDLNYGDTAQLHSQLEETSKLLEAYAARTLASAF